jgi:hypothetical protein
MSPNEYRERALEFAYRAEVANDPEKRERLENLAAAYFRLAQKAMREQSPPAQTASS